MTPTLLPAWGFGSLAMLGWLAAALAPWILHLLNRRRYRQVTWAAMDFLLAALRKKARRLQIEQWILLALRTLVILLVVLALAQPYLERASLFFASGARTHRILVLDASFSMDYRPTDASLFDRAKELAASIVDEGMQGDGYSLVLLSDPPRVIVGSPSFEPARVVTEIEELVLPHGGADLPGTLAEVDRILAAARSDYPRLTQRQVYFLTDLGRSAWSPSFDTAQAEAQFKSACRRTVESAGVAVLDLGQADAVNLAVSSLRLEDPFATTASEVTFSVGVNNLIRQPRAQVLLELLVDGRRVGERRIDLPAAGSRNVSIPYRFDAPGPHAIEARVSSDPLDVDNHRYLALAVKPGLRVLSVDGDPEKSRLRGAGRYLSLALNPDPDDPRAAVKVEVASEAGLVERDLSQYDALFLANVAQFTAREADLLAAYLEHGGGIVYFLGPRVMAKKYNEALFDRPGQRLIPCRLGSIVAENRYTLDPLDYRHPLVQVFKGQGTAGLVTRFPLVHNYFKLELPDDSRPAVALALDGGDPLIVEESALRGKIVLVGTSGDASWSSMPMWPNYLPLVQELLALAVTRSGQGEDHLVGEAIGQTVRFPSATELIVRPPRGDLERVPLVSDAQSTRWTFADTWTSGMYQAEWSTPSGQSQWFAVNVDTAESEVARIDPGELPAGFILQGEWGNLDASAGQDVKAQSGVHAGLLFVAFGLLFAESFLAWWFGRHSR